MVFRILPYTVAVVFSDCRILVYGFKAVLGHFYGVLGGHWVINLGDLGLF